MLATGRETLVVLAYEKGGKYKQYKDKLICNIIASKKCGCPFKLKERLVKGIEWKFFCSLWFP